MYVVVKHSVSDPAKFWSVAQEAAGALPQGVRIHSTLPNREGSTAVCLWEADSVGSPSRIPMDDMKTAQSPAIITCFDCETTVQGPNGMQVQVNAMQADRGKKVAGIHSAG
jgi:hypothetical protein